VKIACVIPSKNPDNLRACVSAVRLKDPAVRIIVVWDGERSLASIGADFPADVTFIEGKKPFVWARNMNLGISELDRSVEGYVLLNDDAILETPDGFSHLAEAAEHGYFPGRREGPPMGLVSAAIRGAVAAKEQEPVSYPFMKEQEPMWDKRSVRPLKHHMMAFVAVYIPFSVFWQVGTLDERFTGYGYDDDDYCQRVKDAGYNLGVFDGCVVEHGSHPSTYRSQPGTSLAPNYARFLEKWGHPPGKIPAKVHHSAIGAISEA